MDITPHDDHPAIEANDLTVRYGNVVALDGVDLRVDGASVLAILGPNGAGKSSLVECLIGYRRPDAGTVRVLGVDPWRAGPRWRARIGVVLQDSRTDADLTVHEYVSMVAGYYGAGGDDVAAAVAAVGLEPQLRQRVHKLSGGQRRRVELAVAVVGQPDVVFLDEPTSGLDPQARRDLWQVVSELRRQGHVVVLTTHQLDEAEALADRVLVVSSGRVVHEGTVAEIRQAADLPATVRFEMTDPPCLASARVRPLGGGRWEASTTDPATVVAALSAHAAATGCTLRGLDVHTPTFEEVYLHLVARRPQEVNP